MKNRYDSKKFNELGIAKMKEIQAKAQDLVSVIQNMYGENMDVGMAMDVDLTVREIDNVALYAVSMLKEDEKYLESEEK